MTRKKSLLSFFCILVLVLTPLIMFGCGQVSSNTPQKTVVNKNNYWQSLSINMVELGNGQGTRLQFFPLVEMATFHNVVISYTVHSTNAWGTVENHVLTLTSSGHGRSEPCLMAFPRIVDVTGFISF